MAHLISFIFCPLRKIFYRSIAFPLWREPPLAKYRKHAQNATIFILFLPRKLGTMQKEKFKKDSYIFLDFLFIDIILHNKRRFIQRQDFGKLRCKQYKFDAKHGFRQIGMIRNETFEWDPDSLPQFMNFILYRTCHIFASPVFYTKHYPGSFTLRVIVNGNATYRMKNKEWELELGDMFISIPGIPIVLYNANKGIPLEWYEFQILGKTAYDTLCLTGCSIHKPVRKTEKTEQLLAAFQQMHEYCSRTDRKYLKSLSYFMELMDLLSLEETSRDSSAVTVEEQLVRNVKNLLESSHFALGKNIEELASQYFQVNRTTLFRAFREVEGVPPKQYLLELRLKRAKELLQTTGFSLTEIAEASGFRSSKYFINFFHQRTGFTPEDWRSMVQKT